MDPYQNNYMQVDIRGKINEKKLAFNNTLLPLFEAVVNSIHAIEEGSATNPGIVKIDLIRSPQSVVNFGEPGNVPPFRDFVITDNGIGFTDRNYDSYMISPYVATNADVIREWLLATNTLTMAKARTIAEAAIKAAGIPMNKMQFGAPQKAEQLKGWLNRGDFKWLPYNTFHWESDLGHCYVDVSGLTTNVVRFDYGGPYMRFETLTNSQVFDGYIQMLGLPTNTVFVKRMFTRPPQYETLPPWR